MLQVDIYFGLYGAIYRVQNNFGALNCGRPLLIFLSSYHGDLWTNLRLVDSDRSAAPLITGNLPNENASIRVSMNYEYGTAIRAVLQAN